MRFGVGVAGGVGGEGGGERLWVGVGGELEPVCWVALERGGEEVGRFDGDGAGGGGDEDGAVG